MSSLFDKSQPPGKDNGDSAGGGDPPESDKGRKKRNRKRQKTDGADVTDEDSSPSTEEDGEGKHNSVSVPDEENNSVSKRSPTLREWVQKRREIPETEKQECIRQIDEDKLEFGKAPFNSEENAKDFFEDVFGVNNARTRKLGTLAHRESKKYLGTLCLLSSRTILCIPLTLLTQPPLSFVLSYYRYVQKENREAQKLWF
jgi:hypothetical protein